MVHEPVDHRRGDDVVAEDLPPAGERLIAGEDHRRALIPGGHQREHQVRCLRVKRDVANLVDDQQRDPAERGELVLDPAVALGVGQPGDPLGRGRKTAPGGQRGRRRSRTRSPSVSWRCRARPTRRCTPWRAGNRAARDARSPSSHRALETEVELLQGLARREPRLTDPRPAAVAITRGHLGLKQ